MSTADHLANRHFLVVDDEPFIRTLVARFLNQSGAAGVVEASDGQEAIEAILSYDMAFDAVITDIKMRRMNGLELLSAIRTGARGLKRNMPVLMLTAHAEAEHVTEALALDADAFVVKPVGREALIDRIVRVLDRSIPIQRVATYAAVGVGNGVAAVSMEIGPAPPNRPLTISVGSLLGVSGTRAESSRRAVAEASLDTAVAPVAIAKELALVKVKENSILAQDIYFGEPPKLLVAAPAILTKALLDRLKDLRQLHDSYSHVFVIDPR